MYKRFEKSVLLVDEKEMDKCGLSKEELGDTWISKMERDAEFRKKLIECGADVMFTDGKGGSETMSVEEFFKVHK